MQEERARTLARETISLFYNSREMENAKARVRGGGGVGKEIAQRDTKKREN